MPADQKQFTALNAELAKLWKPIIERKPAPPDADEWKDVKEKLRPGAIDASRWFDQKGPNP